MCDDDSEKQLKNRAYSIFNVKFAQGERMIDDTKNWHKIL